MRTKPTGQAWRGADLAELEARDGDHTFGRPERLVDWSIAVDKRLWWVVMQ